MMSTKNSTEARQKAIKELIQKFAISDQKQLIDLLWEHEKIQTNQAVTSRDLRTLGIVKKMVKGILVYEVPEIDATAEILRLGTLNVQHNESMIVVSTYPGLAPFIGDCIDQFTDLDILGCLAGENMVFVSPKTIRNICQTYDALCQKLYFKQKKVS